MTDEDRDRETEAVQAATADLQSLSLDEMAALLGVSSGALRRYLEQYPTALPANRSRFSQFLQERRTETYEHLSPLALSSDVRDLQAFRNAVVHSPVAKGEAQAIKPERLPGSIVPTEELLKRLAPPQLWPVSPIAKRVRAAARNKKSIHALILAVDIRHSSFVMYQAVDPHVFAATMEQFVADAREIVWTHEGWFGNFTGDGFLGFWPIGGGTAASRRALVACLDAVSSLFDDFEASQIPRFASNSQNYREDIALGIGLDHGDVAIVRVGESATVVGPAVVGAMRLVDAARGWEALANNHLGVFISDEIEGGRLNGMDVKPVVVDTKDQALARAYSISYGWSQSPLERRSM